MRWVDVILPVRANLRREMAKLAPKQAKFVECYLVDLNATQAAIRAGYAPASAHVTGSKLLKVPKVASAVEAAMHARAKRTDITADRVLQELFRVATSDLAKAFAKDGKLLNVHDMPDEARAALSGVDTEELFEGQGDERVLSGLSRKVKNWDKVKALELLGKHLVLFRDKLEVSGKDGEALSITIDMGAK